MVDKKVFIDTNIIIEDFLFRVKNKKEGEKSYKALVFLERNKAVSYLASFSIVQFVSTCQRAKISDELILQEIKKILGKYQIIDFTKEDIRNSYNQLKNNDIEDVWQYTLCRKVKCSNILTNNKKDFQYFADISVFKPQKVRLLFF